MVALVNDYSKHGDINKYIEKIIKIQLDMLNIESDGKIEITKKKIVCIN